MKEKIYAFVPNFLQNAMVSLYNIQAYRVRYGGKYKEYRKQIFKNRNLSLDELLTFQKDRYSAIIQQSIQHSSYFKKLYKDIESPEDIQNIKHLPIISKEDLRANIKDILVHNDKKLMKSKTGGTTGKSLEVYFTFENTQERFAFLDDFRSRFGYELGKRTAWFSGKNLLTPKDIKKNRFWKTDYYYKVRYYSTFHIKEDYLKYYVEDLIKFQPEYYVGFPSTMLSIAQYGLQHGYDYPKGVTQAIFPTAESVNKEMRRTIEEFFKTKIYDQYASSEGAPFIFECKNSKLHLELQSGVFEVLDEQNQVAKKGKLVVTSFTTEATPLIRYDIGDSIVLEDERVTCNCGNHNPLVKEILGRIDDYIFSPENGKINLGNISNTLKDTYGILKFKVWQNDLNTLDIAVVKDESLYEQKVEKKFLQNWKDRVGDNMIINLKYVDDIPVEKSGKYRIIENNIKHLL